MHELYLNTPQPEAGFLSKENPVEAIFYDAGADIKA